MSTHPPIATTRAAERWQRVRNHVEKRSPEWRRILEAQKNWRKLAAALEPYFDDFSKSGRRVERDYYLERIDKKHRYGLELERLHRIWLDEHVNRSGKKGLSLFRSLFRAFTRRRKPRLSFFDWLDKHEDKLAPTARGGVEYLDASDRHLYKARIDRGRIFLSPSALAVRDYLAQVGGRSDQLIFVVDENHQLYAAPKRVHQFQHTSFFAGAPVRMAGTLKTDAALRITVISSYSGHYAPTESDLEAFLSRLQNERTNLHRIQLQYYADNGDDKAELHADNWLRRRKPHTLRTRQMAEAPELPTAQQP